MLAGVFRVNEDIGKGIPTVLNFAYQILCSYDLRSKTLIFLGVGELTLGKKKTT